MVAIRKMMLKYLWVGCALLLPGCAHFSPPANRDASHAYVPHPEILAPQGSPENPDNGAGLIASLLQTFFGGR